MLTPEQIAKSGTEHAHQAALMQWGSMVWKHPLWWFMHAIPNGGGRTMSVGAQMKAEGVRKGVPDLSWPIRRFNPSFDLGTVINGDHYSGLYLEMKKPKIVSGMKRGSLSREQVTFLNELREQGFAVAVAWGWQAAAWVVYEYEAGRLAMPKDELYLLAAECDAPPPVVGR